MEELKRCPFCGGEAVLEDMGEPSVFDEGQYFVRCKKCCAEQGGLWKTKRTAIKRWNRRVEE